MIIRNHSLNKQKFQDAMQKRGWIMDEATHSWIRPNSRTQAEAEQNWIDAIIESIDCVESEQLEMK